MEPSVTRIVDRLQNTQTLRVENAPRSRPAAAGPGEVNR
jgi:hypothetical protein